MKNMIVVICVLVGSLIGAGFASGKEIEIFFCQYGNYGIAGIFLSTCLIGVILYLVYYISYQYNIETYYQFIDLLIKKSTYLEKAKWMKAIAKNIVNLFLLISFFVMVAGFGSYFYQECHIAPVWGALVLATLCYLTFRKGIQGITKISSIVIPILILFILILGMQKGILSEIKSNAFWASSPCWFFSAILYSFYNSILIIPIFFSLKKYILDKKSAGKMCILFVFIIFLLATIIYRIVIEHYEEVVTTEMPMLYLMKRQSNIYQYLYGLLILVSIYTSAISTRIWILTKCGENQKSKNSN